MSLLNVAGRVREAGQLRHDWSSEGAVPDQVKP